MSALVLTVVVLYLAKGVVVSLALAVLFSFLLGPQARSLERRGIPRVPAVLMVVSVFLCLFALIGWITATQLFELAAKIPTYQGNIENKLVALRGHGGALKSAAEILAQVEKKAEVTASKAEASGALPTPKHGAGEPDKPPLAVRIVAPPAGPLQWLRSLFEPLLAPMAMLAGVVIFTVFILIEREDLRDRMLHLAGPENLPLTTQAVDEAGSRVSRYLQAQVAVNATMGVAITAGLFFIHVPNAALWGLLAALFRFVPFVGFWASSLAPLALSLAAFDSWGPVALTATLYVTLEVVTTNALEPYIYGEKTGLSPVALIVAATFWTWLWGGVGLLLSTPLTVCLVVLGRYIPQLEFLHTLLGDQPLLPLDARLYQRLLANDQEEIAELINSSLEKKSYAEVCDEMVLPALNRAEIDTQHGLLNDDRHHSILQTLRMLAEELRDWPPNNESPLPDGSEPVPRVEAAGTLPEPLTVRILILPVRTEGDEIAALLFSELLTASGIANEVLPFKTLLNDMIKAVTERQVALVCLSAVRPFAVMQARHLAKRLNAALPEVKVLVGLWDSKTPSAGTRRNLATTPANWIVSTLAEALGKVRETIQCLPEPCVPLPALGQPQAPLSQNVSDEAG